MKTLTTACGCEIHVIKWSSKANSVTMQSCPLHKAAKDLLEAARRMRTVTAIGFEARDEAEEGNAWEQLNTAVEAAEGKQ